MIPNIDDVRRDLASTTSNLGGHKRAACPDRQRFLVPLVAGLLSPSTVNSLRLHIEGCGVCRLEVRALKELMDSRAKRALDFSRLLRQVGVSHVMPSDCCRVDQC